LVIDGAGQGETIRQTSVEMLDRQFEIEQVTLQIETKDGRDGRDRYELH
jgi:hypothetical protein